MEAVQKCDLLPRQLLITFFIKCYGKIVYEHFSSKYQLFKKINCLKNIYHPTPLPGTIVIVLGFLCTSPPPPSPAPTFISILSVVQNV